MQAMFLEAQGLTSYPSHCQDMALVHLKYLGTGGKDKTKCTEAISQNDPASQVPGL